LGWAWSGAALFCSPWAEAVLVVFSVVEDADCDGVALLAVVFIGISDAVVALEGAAWAVELLVATSDVEG
jgi:hypothetical protein